MKKEVRKTDHKIDNIRELISKVTGLKSIEAKENSIEFVVALKKYYENIISNMPGNVYWMNREHVFLGCNNNVLKWLGLKSANEYIGKTYEDFYAPKYASAYNKVDEQVMRTGKEIYVEESGFTEISKDIIHLTHKVPLFDENDNVVGMLGVSIDITDKKKAEEEIKRANLTMTDNLKNLIKGIMGLSDIKEKSPIDYAFALKEYYENIIANIPGHVYWMNKEHVFLGCNNNVLSLLNLQKIEDYIGKTYEDFYNQKDAVFYRETDKKVMNSGKEIHLEESYSSSRGEPRVGMTHKVPLLDESNNVIGMLGVSIDITKRKELEKKLKQSEIKEKAQKAKTQGMMEIAAGIAHEIKTPLVSIQNATDADKYLDRLISAYKLAQDAGLPVEKIRPSHFESLKTIFKSIDREAKESMEIIDLFLGNLKYLAEKVNTGDFSEYSVVDCIDAALSRYPFKIDQQTQIHWSNTPDFKVYGNKLFIQHIIFNLLRNAFYYISGRTDAKITIRQVQGKDANKLYFKDTGAGIDPKDQKHIFEFGFSKKKDGTGFGLTYCKNVMEQMGGDIVVNSELGKYTEFILTFPKISE